MTIEFRTKIATILRQVEQGILTASAAYHRIANLYAEESHQP
jgi:hypothetical protein